MSVSAPADLSTQAQALLDEMESTLARAVPVTARGRVSKTVGMLIHAIGIQAHVGELCELVTPGAPRLWAEVVGFENNTCILTPLGSTAGLSTATEVRPSGRGHVCPVGPELLGRVIDALGDPMDSLGPLKVVARWPAHREPVSPLARQMVSEPMTTGLRAIDGLLTLGVGQRMGVFAPPGVGKSTLLGMLARGASADVIVVGLIGERGREVKEFIEHNLDAESRARTVMVVSTSDRPPMERIKSAYVATTIAEYFRDQGLSVLLLVDSLTRFARAQREIGLASGEPPTRRSYPPSIFSMLPQLLERAGQGRTGAITAVYSVLTEGDEENDPIAEEVRSILDGHIVLSRKLAAANHYPAIDVLASVSRVMPMVTSAEHRSAAGRARALLARYQEIELLVQIGEYETGHDAQADAAVNARDSLAGFLKQPADALQPLAQTIAALSSLVDAAEAASEQEGA